MSWRQYLIAILLLEYRWSSLRFCHADVAGHPAAESATVTGPAIRHLALNTAVGFVTNTNWQSYAGETTLSWFQARWSG